MLIEFIELKNPKERSFFIKNFESSKTSWIVSDLKSKQEIQNIILEKQSYLESDSVLRASELWKIFLKKYYPELKIVNNEFIVAYLKEKLIKEESLFLRKSESILFDFIHLMMPIITHPQGESRIKAWVLDRPQSLRKWWGWFDKAQQYYNFFLKERIISPQWIVSIIQKKIFEEKDIEKNKRFFGTKGFIFDLGGNLTMSEAEIILEISRVLPVRILAPAPAWSSKFSYLMEAYDFLKTHAHSLQKKDPSSLLNLNFQKFFKELTSPKENSKETASPAKFSTQNFFQFTSPLAEVKQATAQIRKWIEEENILPHNISILAPNIETYWPLLYPYFQKEGIPFEKKILTRLHSFKKVQQWLSCLKLAIGNFSYGDLELSYFQKPSDSQLRFEVFKSLFIHLLDEDDLGREKTIEQAFKMKISKDKTLNIDTFIGIALNYWPSENLENQENLEQLNFVLSALLSNAHTKIEMSPVNWLHYLEGTLAKKELSIDEEEEAGVHSVQIGNLMAGDALPSEKRIILGLNKSSFKKKGSPLIEASEIVSIANDLGFFLDNPDEINLSFELDWLLEMSEIENHLYCSKTNINGAAETPHPLFLKTNNLSSSSQRPLLTRWDKQLYNANLDSSVAENSEENSLNQQRLQLPPGPKLSPSSIEAYRRCPFIFAAEKIFCLANPSEADIDIDIRTKGQLVHLIFELIAKKYPRMNASENEILDLLNEIKKQNKVKIFENSIWPGLRERYLNLAMRFQEQEKQWRIAFPESRIFDVEIPFSFYLDSTQNLFLSKIFSEAQSKNNYETSNIDNDSHALNDLTDDLPLMRGKIDRIDINAQEQIVVVDYKASKNSERNFSVCLSKNHLQLGIYALALEKGLVEKCKEKTIIGAVYYSYKDFDRTQGFKIEEFAGSLFPPSSSRSKKISQSDKSEFFKKLTEIIFESLSKMKEGEFHPKPLEEKTCTDCPWRGLCRATHLN